MLYHRMDILIGQQPPLSETSPGTPHAATNNAPIIGGAVGEVVALAALVASVCLLRRHRAHQAKRRISPHDGLLVSQVRPGSANLSLAANSLSDLHSAEEPSAGRPSSRKVILRRGYGSSPVIPVLPSTSGVTSELSGGSTVGEAERTAFVLLQIQFLQAQIESSAPHKGRPTSIRVGVECLPPTRSAVSHPCSPASGARSPRCELSWASTTWWRTQPRTFLLCMDIAHLAPGFSAGN
ncbi:hypothetical protein C8Q77DRAFT_865929 [Trametes polyzona]|nr:hypothetical protein C8Q77DRAFT_865929 [Trametes polyzona]